MVGAGADDPPTIVFWLLGALFSLLAWIIGGRALRSGGRPGRWRLGLVVLGGAFLARGTLGLLGDLAAGLDTPSARADALVAAPLAVVIGWFCLSAGRDIRA